MGQRTSRLLPVVVLLLLIPPGDLPVAATEDVQVLDLRAARLAESGPIPELTVFYTGSNKGFIAPCG